MSRTYPIKYKIQFSKTTKEEALAEGAAVCDEMAICSVVRFPDGAGSIAWHTNSGQEGQEMRAKTLYSAWLALAAVIAKSPDLNNAQREVVLNAINSSRTKTEKIG